MPGNDVRPFHGELSPALKEHVHPRLIEFWEKVGFGSFGNGFITFFDPREAETMLARWLLLQQPDPTRVPIARTAFGDLIYFRDLRQRAAENGLEANWKNGSDVVFLSIHYRGSSAITWSVDDFLSLVTRYNPRVPGRTADFVRRWHSIATRPASPERDRQIAEAITDRELRTKGARAPLHNPKARDGWKPGDGLMVLDYNWSVMQRIVRDIIQGADDAAA